MSHPQVEPLSWMGTGYVKAEGVRFPKMDQYVKYQRHKKQGTFRKGKTFVHDVKKGRKKSERVDLFNISGVINLETVTENTSEIPAFSWLPVGSEDQIY